MKRVFTFPDNEADHYIDPDLIGDDTVGFQKRIKELKDGTYMAWQGATPSGSVDNIMSDLSKFNNAPWLENEGGNNTINAFWKTPFTATDMELIESDISSATATDGVDSLIEFSGDHGFYSGQKMTLSNFDNAWSGLNSDSLYVDKIDSDTIKLCTDSNLTLPIQFYDLENCDVDDATATNPAIFQKPIADHDLQGGTLVRASNFDGDFAQFNGSDFYVRQVGPNGFKLSYDNVGNDLIEFPQQQFDVPIEQINVLANGQLQMVVDPTALENPDGTEVTFDPNNATVFGIQGANTGLSTALSNPYGFSNVYLQNTGTTHLYDLTTDAAGNNPAYVYSITDVTGPDELEIAKGITTQLNLVNNKYFLKYYIYDAISGNLDGNLFNFHSVNPLSMSSLNSVPASGSYTGYRLDHQSGSEYELLHPTSFGNPNSGRVELDYDILNAKKVRYTQPSDDKFFFHDIKDSAGVSITTTSYILNADTISDVTEINTKCLGQMTTARASDIDNLPTYGYAINTRRTATYQSDSIIDLSGSGAPHEVSQTFGTAGLTTYETLDASGTSNSLWNMEPEVAGHFEVIEAPLGASAQDAWVREIHTQYNIDPQNVVGKVFVMDCGRGSDYNSFTHATTRYYCITKVYTASSVHGPEKRVGIQLFATNTDGSLTTARRKYTNTFPPWVNETWAITFGSGSKKRFKTYNLAMYDREGTSGSNTVTLTWPTDFDSITGSGTAPGGSRYDLGTSHSLTWTAGQNVTLRVKRTSDNAVLRTTKHAARYSHDDPAVTGSSNTTFTHPRYMWLFNLNDDGTYQTTPTITDFTNEVTGSRQAYSGSDFTDPFYLEIEIHNDYFWQRNSNVFWYEPPADNRLFVSGSLDVNLTDNKIYGIPYGTYNDEVTTFDTVAQVWTDATQGTLIEVYTPPTENIIPVLDTTDATQGTLTIEDNETYRYRMTNPRLFMPGNLTYMQRTGASTYVNNAELNDERYQIAGYENTEDSYGEWPVTTVSTNGSGYVTGFSYDSEFPGAFPTANDVLFEVEAVPDTYTPPAQSVASQQDNWDLDDAWTSTAYVGGSGKKEWPDHVTPSTAQITLNSPTIVNKSQNGIKYSRKSGFTKWTLEVEYPPMTKGDFQIFHGIAQAAQGQAVPFLFKLNNKDGNNILWKEWFKNTDGTILPLFKEDMAAVTTTALFEGFASDTTQAFARGEVIGLNGANDNGDLHTVLTDVDSNAYGEAKIRITYPVKEGNTKGTQARKKPNSCVVTLNNDDFTYSVDHMGYYLVSVSFELDNYK